MATIKELLQEVRNRSWDSFGVKPPHSSLFIKSLEGEVLTYEHYLPFSKQEEFISNFVKARPDVRLFQVERVQFPNDLNSSLAREIYQAISTFGATNQELYEKNKVLDCDYIYDATSQKTYPPFHEWNSLPQITQVYLVSECPEGIAAIKDPSEAVQMAAIKKNPSCITLLDSPCEAAQIYAVQQDPFIIPLISPTEKTILTAVEKEPLVLRNFKNLSKELQLQIAKLVPTAIRYIDNPSEEIQLIAVEKNPHAIGDIANPTEKAQLIAISKDYNVLSEINGPTPQVSKIAIEQLYNNKITIDISSLPSIDSFCRDSQLLIDNISKYPRQEQGLLSDFEKKYMTKNAEVRKAVDDAFYSAHGMDNPNPVNKYYANQSKDTQPKLYDPRKSLETISKHYQERGYTSIVDTINKHLPAYEKLCEIGATNYKIEQIEICSTQNKKLYADIFLDYREQRPALLIENLKIQDLSTGKMLPANKIWDYCSENNFSIFDMPKSEVENLLSGGKIPMPGKSMGQLMGLNKTIFGYGLKTCKQFFSMMDSSAEI